LTVRDGKAYIAMDTGGLCIVDVSDPTQPTVLGRVDLPGHARTVKLGEDGHAYLSCGADGLAIVNVSNPSSPTHVAQFPTGDALRDFCLIDGWAYLAAGASGLIIADVSNPASPQRLGAYTA